MSDYIRLKDLREELGITAKGLDNALNRKDIKKKYPFKKGIPYLNIDDANIIRKHIATNGRVKSILDKDKKEFELEQEYSKLKEDYSKLNDELSKLKFQLENNSITINELKEDKESYKGQIEHLHKQQNKYQERLEEANKLLLLEKAESDKFKKLYTENKQQLLLLEEEKEISIAKIETSYKEQLSTIKEDIASKEIAIISISKELQQEKETAEELKKKLNEIESKNLFALIKYKLTKK